MAAELVLNWFRAAGPPAAALAGDALSVLLTELRPTSWVSGLCSLSRHCAVAFPAAPASVILVSAGRLLVRRDPDAVPLEARKGDAVVLIGGTTHVICDDVASPVQPVDRFVSREQVRDRRPVVLGRGPACASFLGAAVRFDPVVAPGLLRSLPGQIFVSARADGGGALGVAIQLLEDRASDTTPGSHALLNCLVGAIVVEAIRAHAHDTPPPTGVLRAAADERIGPVVSLMHADLAKPWTLERLSLEAGLSRSSFCERFRDLMGHSPATYLRHVRMRHAARLIRTTELELASIAAQVGYRSEGAFCTAFKNWAGRTPGAYRTARDASLGLRPNDARPASV